MVELTPQARLSVQLVTKEPYQSSGPRGVDLYASNLYEELSLSYPKDTYQIGPLKKNQEHLDIIHYAFFDPYALTLKRPSFARKCIVTVHDLIPLKFSDHFPAGLRGKFKWQIQKWQLKRADAIITDSHSSADDISLLVGYPKERIYVIPLAAPNTTITADLARSVQKEYALPSRYILYVGDINWNKNVVGLINAFATLKDPSVHLVLVGKAFVSGKGTREHTEITSAIENSGRSERIHLLGFLPSHHLPAIYQQATLYVQPSWYEGFGFPLLEAMSQNCPVLSSNQGSLKEVGGEFVHYFDPKVKNEFETTLQDLMSDAKKRTSLVEGGKTWTKNFTWKHAARNTREVYAKILA